MSELRGARHVRARFARPVERIPSFDGLVRSEANGHEVTLEMTGPLPPLLQWLATQPIVDLQVEPLGLSGIYHRYHGAPA